MFLSAQQKFILDVLKKLGCVRRTQLHALVRGQFGQEGFEITQGALSQVYRSNLKHRSRTICPEVILQLASYASTPRATLFLIRQLLRPWQTVLTQF